MFNVVVLGAGPAGLLAAHTAVALGAGVSVWSLGQWQATQKAQVPVKSELYGCQYLHYPVLKGLGETKVSYQLNGTVEEYRAKVYGQSNWMGPVSPDEYGPEEDHPAWDLRQMYEMLWNFWGTRIQTVDKQDAIDYAWLRHGLLAHAEVDAVISTIPRTVLCAGRLQGSIVDGREHTFSTQDVWAMGARVDGLRSGVFDCPDDTVMCDGTKSAGWYRKSRVFGMTTVEWPWRDGHKPPLKGVVPVQKPLSHTCTCWQHEDRLHFLGRYGRWQKGYLVHEVVQGVHDIFDRSPQRLF